MSSKKQSIRTAAFAFVGLAALSSAAMAASLPGRVGDGFGTAPSVRNVPQVPPKRCKTNGSWTEAAGGEIVLKGKKGTWTYPSECTFSLKLSNKTTAGFDVTATVTSGSCQCFTEALDYQGSCDSVAGTFTNCDGSMGNDSWTKN